MQPQGQSQKGTPRMSRQSGKEIQQYDSFIYKFQQQIISAWKPVPHPSSNVILYLILTAVCLTLGIALILTAPSSQQIYIRYDNQCTLGTSCTVSFTLTNSLKPPIYFYYGLNGFYQNHRRYLRYFSFSQLSKGNQLSDNLARTDCSSFTTNLEIGFTQSCAKYQTSGCTAFNASINNNVAFPCGTRSKIYAQLRKQILTYTLKYGATPITMSRNGIVWPQDVGIQKNFDVTQQPFDVTEEEWLVWYRPAARSSFFKLHRKIEQELQPGNYTITFDNVFPSVFGEKWLQISKSNYVGNRDLFLGIAFTCLGGICLILCFVFIAKWVNQMREKSKQQ